jgi:hypothetical protein
LTVSLAFGLAPLPSLRVVMAIPEALLYSLGSAASAWNVRAISIASGEATSLFMNLPLQGCQANAGCAGAIESRNLPQLQRSPDPRHRPGKRWRSDRSRFRLGWWQRFTSAAATPPPAGSTGKRVRLNFLASSMSVV